MTEIDAGFSLWDGPSEEVVAQRTAALTRNAVAAVEPLWPYLSGAATRAEFEQRMSLLDEGIASRVAAVADDGHFGDAKEAATAHLSARWAEHEENVTANRLRALMASQRIAGDGQTAEVMAFPQCQICQQKDAAWDGKTVMGPWAYMCDSCHDEVGLGQGLGVGQKLVLAPSSKESAAKTAADAGNGHTWIGPTLRCPSSDKDATVRTTSDGLICNICGKSVHRATQSAKTAMPLPGDDRLACPNCNGTMRMTDHDLATCDTCGRGANPKWLAEQEGTEFHVAPNGVLKRGPLKEDQDWERFMTGSKTAAQQCTYDSGSMYGNTHRCTNPATYVVTYHNGSGPASTAPVCDQHKGPMMGRYPFDDTKVEKISSLHTAEDLDDDKVWYEWGYSYGERVRAGEVEPGSWTNADGTKIDWENSDAAFPRGYRDGLAGKPKTAAVTARHPGAQGYHEVCPKCHTKTENFDRGWEQISHCPKCNWLGHKMVTSEASLHTAWTDAQSGAATWWCPNCLYEFANNADADHAPTCPKCGTMGASNVDPEAHTSSLHTAGPKSYAEYVAWCKEVGFEPMPKSNWQDARGFLDEAERKGHYTSSSLHTAETNPPYYIEEKDGKYVVVNDEGHVKGTFDTKDEARQQQKALYANVPGASEEAEKQHGDPKPKVQSSQRTAATSEHAQRFADGLNAKHGQDGPWPGYHRFHVEPGRKYDKIVQTHGQPDGGGAPERSGSVHAFVERETGHVYKPAGWQTPAKGVRYQSVDDALKHSDPHGGYLYAGRTSAVAALLAEAATQQVDGVSVHTFDSTGEAYDASQTSDDIHDGDILSVPSEGVVGFLYEAWPVAVTPEHGEFHGLTDEAGFLAENPQYAHPMQVAKSLSKTASRTAGGQHLNDEDEAEWRRQMQEDYDDYWRDQPGAIQSSLHTAAEGYSVCPTCKGSGAHPWDASKKCPKCKGTGYTRPTKKKNREPDLESLFSSLRGPAVTALLEAAVVTRPTQLDVLDKQRHDDDAGEADLQQRHKEYWDAHPEEWDQHLRQNASHRQAVTQGETLGISPDLYPIYADEGAYGVGGNWTSVADALGWEEGTYLPNGDGVYIEGDKWVSMDRIGSRKQAVNDSAYGTDRYQHLDAPAKPSWITEWADEEMKATKEMTEEGMSAYVKPNPFPNLTTLQRIRNTALKMAGEQAYTTKPAQVPGQDEAHMVTLDEQIIPPTPQFTPDMATQPADASAQMGSGGGFDMGYGQAADPMAPTPDQLVAAKAASLADRIQLDNPSMERAEAHKVALRTIAKHPEMVSLAGAPTSATCPGCGRENVAIRNGKYATHKDPNGNRCIGSGQEWGSR